MPKSSKRFVISNSGLNSQGFRLLTSGADLTAFEKNPLLLFNHQRPTGNRTDQVLPLGRWEDLKVEGDEISGVPVFDDDDEFAMKIFNKVEAGTMKMCSAGAKIHETSPDPKYTLPGQTKETATRWEMMEGSICDIGSNPGAMAVALYDQDDNIITLSDSTIQTLTPDMTEKEKAAKEAAEKKAAEVKLAAENADAIARLEKENADLKEKLEAAEKEKDDTRVASLVDGAVRDKKITEKQKAQYVKLANADFDTTADLIKSLPTDVTLADRLSGKDTAGKAKTERIAKLSAMSGEELYRQPGSFKFLEENAPEIHKLKYKEKFGKEPKSL